MPIQVQGNVGVIAEVDGSVYQALRVTTRPVDYGVQGEYRANLQSGTMAAGLVAFSQVFQARWTASPQLALVWGIAIDGMAATTAFVAGGGYFGLLVGRSWTVDGSGGTPAVLTGNNAKARTSMGTSLMGSMRISNTGALTTGTSTLDTQGLGHIYFAIGTSANTIYLRQTGLYGAVSLEDGGNNAPVVLAQNEGVVIVAAVPGTGTWQFSVSMAWSEVASY